jgi:hypothetical protein
MVRILDIDRLQAVVSSSSLASPRTYALAGAVTLALGACSDAPRCEPIERCDIRTSGCQRAALQHAACLRGRDEHVEDLDISVVTLDREAYLDQAGDAAEEESEGLRQMRSGLALFELAAPPSESAEARVARARLVGGFYDPDEQRITVIDSASAWHSAGSVLTLVHEMVHVLQDAAGQLDADPPVHSFDQALARRAIVEGEATVLSAEAAAEGYGFSFRDLDYARALRNYRSSSLHSSVWFASPFDSVFMRFPYAFGASYLWPLREEGAGVLGAAFAEPPVSTYAVMNADPSEPALRENDLGDSAAPVLPDLTRVGCYRLGRFLYEVWRRKGHDWLPFGDQFVADNLCVFADGEASVIATWRIRFASESAAIEAAQAIDVARASSLGSGSEGNDVWWAAGVGSGLPAELAWEAAPVQDFGFVEEEPASRRIHCPRSAIRGEASP